MNKRLARLLRRSAMRQSLILSAVFLVAMIIAGVLVLGTSYFALDKKIDTMLAQRQAELRAGLVTSSPDVLFGPKARILPNSTNFQGLITPDGVVFGQIPSSINFVRGYQTILFAPRGEDHGGDHKYFWRAYAEQSTTGLLITGTRTDIYNEALELLPATFLISGTLIIVVMLGGGWWFARRNQRRLDHIGMALDQIADGNLDTRISPKEKRDDLDDLAGKIDETTARIGALMVQVRQLSASIAHDLKTPLTRLGIQIETLHEVIEQGDDPTKALMGARQQMDQLSSIFTVLLQIAEFEGGVGRGSMSRLSLAGVVEDVGEIYQAVVEDAGGTLTVSAENTACVKGNRALLVQALSNLIENALRHGGDQVHIHLVARNAALIVEDDGPGIPTDLRAKALRPMQRLDASQDGHGLGLPLVSAIATLHHTFLDLDWGNPDQQAGLRVTLRFANSMVDSDNYQKKQDFRETEEA